MSQTSHRSDRVMPPRIATAPVPAHFRPPPSEISISQDCAFPPFPTNRSRSATPTTPSDPKRSFTFDGAASESQLDSVPQSPKRNGPSILQRMNSIAPGPFNLNDQGHQQPSGHQRTATANSTKDIIRSSNSSNDSSHSRQASFSATTRLRKLSLSSIAGGPRSTVHREVADSPTLPPIPAVANDLNRSPERVQTDKPIRPIEAPSQAGRSQIYPVQSQQESTSTKRRPVATRRPSEPAVVAAMKPLHEIGSTSSFKPSKSLKGRQTPTYIDPETGVSDAIPRPLQSNGTKPDVAPPIPKPIRAREFGTMNPYHAPTESNSSNESSGSDSRSVSSRSTPPVSDSPQRGKRRPSHGGQVDNLLQEFCFGTEQVPIVQEPVPPRHIAPPSYSRPMYPWSADASNASKIPANLSPDSPTDPAMLPRRPGLVQASSDFNSPTVPLQNGNLRLSPAPPLPPAVPVSPVRKSTAMNKGKCRGCNELIKGKSVSSADGRLTGRYHRSCFVCKTCKEPFQTADFYVLDNHPFCARHYHELNHSLCKTCDRGIEGQYLETELKQKFHPYCFTCQECHKILRDDYFEMNGKTYCEQHAFRAAQQQTSLLGPGRRHPERRTTRLMIMA
ncbi:MAG: hypothetical protein Q9213_006703 [Squamulea squamosa]